MKEVDKRREKRFQKKEDDLKLLRMYARHHKLWQAKLKKSWVELEKPIRYGYKRYFILRDDIARSKEADFLKSLLKHVQYSIVSKDKKFEKKNYKTKKMEPMIQELGVILKKDWNKLNFTEKQKAMFDEVWVPPAKYKNRHIGGGHWIYVFKKPWMFTLKTEPYYITHRLVLDPHLESEMKELDNKIKNNNLWPKIGKMMGWTNHRDDWDLNKTKERIIDAEYNRYIKESLTTLQEISYDYYED